jgi:hypothetical protein
MNFVKKKLCYLCDVKNDLYLLLEWSIYAFDELFSEQTQW